MEPKSASHTVFSIPEVAHAVFAALNTQHDLAQSIRVCKHWSHLVEPILWKHFCLKANPGSMPSAQVTAAMVRNMPYIQSVELYSEQLPTLQTLVQGLPHGVEPGISSTTTSTHCAQLRRLKLILNLYKGIESALPYLVTLLSYNHHLTHLTVPMAAIENEAVQGAIPKLRHLQFLAIDPCWSHRGNRRDLMFLLRACLPLPELTELLIDFDMHWSDDDDGDDGENTYVLDEETTIMEASIARFSQNPAATKIKSLRLPFCYKSGQPPLPLRLLMSGLLDLESLTIPLFTKVSYLSKVEPIVRQHCPNLKHLICPSFLDDEYLHHEIVRAFIRGCSGLRIFASDSFSDEKHEGRFSRYDEPLSYQSRFIMWELVSRHSSTLEKVELTNCLTLFSADQQAILSQCSRLKRFWVEIYSQNGLTGLDLADVCMTDWICMELRELSLYLNRCSSEGDPQSTTLAAQAQHFYRQIGRLDKLEELRLGIDGGRDTKACEEEYVWDLTLCKGWLSEMAGLKNLRTLSLDACFWIHMGQTEAEFVYEHWPLLREIRLPGQTLLAHVRSCWKWLFLKRPELRLVVS